MGAHIPVMVPQVLEYLNCQPGAVVVDCTFGAGGHTAAILPRIQPGGRVLAIDQDRQAIAAGQRRFAGQPVTFVHGNFRNLEVMPPELKIEAAVAFLFDLGVSWEQLEAPARGFSFQREGPLDMRMNQEVPQTAADLVNRLPAEALERLLREYGGERWARRIAKVIATSRQRSPITTTAQLAALVTAAIPARARPHRIHPATKTFQALRIAVNDELAALQTGLVAAIHHTRAHGRVVVLSYHSLEDGVTKETLRRLARGCQCPPSLPSCACDRRPWVRVLTRKPLRPGPEEIAANPRARSARLRAAGRLP